MQTSIFAPTLIKKEKVPLLHFPSTEVLLIPEAIASRNIDLKYAVKLGNLDRYKVKIIFEDDHALRKVETTIWAVTEKMVVLKKGAMIPIHRIHEVKFL